LDLPEKATPLKIASGRPTLPSPQAGVIAENEWRELERTNLLSALRQANFRISGKGGAAELLGINPGTLASRLKALGIDKRDYLPGFRAT
jgi:transcriptional regulator with GAF, ATPase, and Fis domain